MSRVELGGAASTPRDRRWPGAVSAPRGRGHEGETERMRERKGDDVALRDERETDGRLFLRKAPESETKDERGSLDCPSRPGQPCSVSLFLFSRRCRGCKEHLGDPAVRHDARQLHPKAHTLSPQCGATLLDMTNTGIRQLQVLTVAQLFLHVHVCGARERCT
eukprot:365159-Chlamydomonas_euryale.AAC.5